MSSQKPVVVHISKIEMAVTYTLDDGSERREVIGWTADPAKSEELSLDMKKAFGRRGEDYWDLGDTVYTIRRTYPPLISAQQDQAREQLEKEREERLDDLREEMRNS